jgi:hypothetical protein
MRLHALLAYYDEPCASLAACIASLTHAGVDHIIASDGAYALYPDARPSSPPNQAAVIHETARTLGLACTIHTPSTVWIGNEVEKRTSLFNIAHALSTPGDWWFVIDADEVILSAPKNLKDQLTNTDHHVAEATLTQGRDLNNPAAQHFNWPRQGQHPMRMLFKAQPIHCQVNHYTYVAGDGRILWSSDSALQEPALDIEDLIVEHRDNQRALDRIQDKTTYYQRRDSIGIERGECDWQGCTEQGTRNVARNFKPSSNRQGYVADLVEACDKHAKRIDYENRWALKNLGVQDPDQALARAEIAQGAAA